MEPQVPTAVVGPAAPPPRRLLSWVASPPPLSPSSPPHGVRTPLRAVSVGSMMNQGYNTNSSGPTLVGSSHCASPTPTIPSCSYVAPVMRVVEEVMTPRYVVPPVTLYRDTLDAFIRSMQASLADLRQAVYTERESRNPRMWTIHKERDARKAVDAKVDFLAFELQKWAERLASPHMLPSNDLRKALDKIEARGNVRVDISSDPGQIHLIRPLLFLRRTAGDPPTAEFVQPELAQRICTDVAEVAKLFDCPVSVEGHTKGGESEFWQALANNRARAVAQKLIDLKIDSSKISCQGRPGKSGVNQSCVLIRLGIPSLSHQPVQSWPQAVQVDAIPVERVVEPVPASSPTPTSAWQAVEVLAPASVLTASIPSTGQAVELLAPASVLTNGISSTGQVYVEPAPIGTMYESLMPSGLPSPSASRSVSLSVLPSYAAVTSPRMNRSASRGRQH